MSKRSGVVVPGRLYFCVGLAASGKSTYCNAWVNGKGESGNPRVVIGGDDFRHALHGQEYVVESEGTVFAMMDIAIRALLHRGFDVIVDETCTTQSTLLRMLKLDLQAVPVFITTPVGVCKERAISAGRNHLLGPIERMNEQLIRLRANWEPIVKKLKKYVLERKGLDVAV